MKNWEETVKADTFHTWSGERWPKWEYSSSTLVDTKSTGKKKRNLSLKDFFNILLGLIGCYLAYKSVQLASVSLALQVKQDTLQSELKQLERIVLGQDSSIRRLTDIIIRLDSQNLLTKNEIMGLTTIANRTQLQYQELVKLTSQSQDQISTSNRQLSINSAILQYLLSAEQGKFNRAQKDLMFVIGKLLTIYAEKSYSYRDITIDSIQTIEGLRRHQTHVIDVCGRMMAVMEANGGNAMLDLQRVESSWGGAYNRMKVMKRSLEELRSTLATPETKS